MAGFALHSAELQVGREAHRHRLSESVRIVKLDTWWRRKSGLHCRRPRWQTRRRFDWKRGDLRRLFICLRRVIQAAFRHLHCYRRSPAEPAASDDLASSEVYEPIRFRNQDYWQTKSLLKQLARRIRSKHEFPQLDDLYTEEKKRLTNYWMINKEITRIIAQQIMWALFVRWCDEWSTRLTSDGLTVGRSEWRRTSDDCRTSETSEKMARAAYSTFLRILRTINEWLATSLGVEVLPFLLFLTITQHIQTAGTHFHTYNHSPAHRPIDVNATDERAKLDLRWRPPSLGVAYSF